MPDLLPPLMPYPSIPYSKATINVQGYSYRGPGHANCWVIILNEGWGSKVLFAGEGG